VLSEHLLYLLATNIHKIPFEARKDTQFIFSNVLRYRAPAPGSEHDQQAQQAAEPLAVHYLVGTRPQVVIALCHGYERREGAMPCGGILREALKFDAVAALILYDEPPPPSPAPGGQGAEAAPRSLADVDTARPSSGRGVFWRFFDWIVKSSFEVCADAFATFRVRDFVIQD
jgi:calcium binding protein 39